jgi:hypothetical protein
LLTIGELFALRLLIVTFCYKSGVKQIAGIIIYWLKWVIIQVALPLGEIYWWRCTKMVHKKCAFSPDAVTLPM